MLLFLSLIMKPWVEECKKLGGEVKILADDILILASGPLCLDKFVDCLNFTHKYLKDMGAKLAEDKSLNLPRLRRTRSGCNNQSGKLLGVL